MFCMKKCCIIESFFKKWYNRKNEVRNKTMVDNRSAGFFGIGGSFNFKSGDISGTAAKTSDEKNGQGGEYFAQGQNPEEDEAFRKEPYVDRSAVLRASLDSLARLNAAGIEKKKIKPKAVKIKKNKKDLSLSEDESQKE